MTLDWETRKEAKDDLFHPNRYGLNLDYIIRDGKTHPLAILLPGGGYLLVCSFVEGRPLAKQLNSMGISVAILYYRIRRRARFPHPAEDAARAVRELTDRAEELHIDMEHYSIWGASAGGNASALFGTESIGWKRIGVRRPSAVVLIYPVITMEAGKTHARSRRFLIGRNPSEARVRAASVEELVTRGYPPTFLWTGDADQSVPPENSRRMDAALTACGVPHEYHVYPGVPHGVGLGLGTSCEGWEKEAVRFWQAQYQRA